MRDNVTYLTPDAPVAGLSDFTGDLVRAFSPETLDRLMSGIRKTHDLVIAAYDTLDQATKATVEIGVRSKLLVEKFGPPIIGFAPNIPFVIAAMPLGSMEAYRKAMGKRVAALDVLLLAIGGAYSSLSLSLMAAGLDTEGGIAKSTYRAIERWRDSLRLDPPDGNGFYNKNPQARQDSMDISQAVGAALAAKGLRRVQDNDKEAYWQTYLEVLQPILGVELEGVPAIGVSGSGMGEPVSITLAIIALVKVVVVVGGVIAALVAINAVFNKLFGAGNDAMAAALEYQKRKTTRQEMVASGTMTQAEADQANTQDASDTKAQQEEAADRARAVSPGLAFTDLILPGIVVVGGIIAVKIATS